MAQNEYNYFIPPASPSEGKGMLAEQELQLSCQLALSAR